MSQRGGQTPEDLSVARDPFATALGTVPPYTGTAREDHPEGKGALDDVTLATN